jgi:hypothetical protein
MINWLNRYKLTLLSNTPLQAIVTMDYLKKIQLFFLYFILTASLLKSSQSYEFFSKEYFEIFVKSYNWGKFMNSDLILSYSLIFIFISIILQSIFICQKYYQVFIWWMFFFMIQFFQNSITILMIFYHLMLIYKIILLSIYNFNDSIHLII